MLWESVTWNGQSILVCENLRTWPVRNPYRKRLRPMSVSSRWNDALKMAQRVLPYLVVCCGSDATDLRDLEVARQASATMHLHTLPAQSPSSSQMEWPVRQPPRDSTSSRIL